MGVFRDQKYEDLDWISQATEPIESTLSTTLGLLPDEIKVTYEQVAEAFGSTYLYDSLNIKSLLQHRTEDILRELGHTNSLIFEESSLLYNCFRFEIEANTYIDFETKTLHGGITIMKVKTTFEDREIERTLGRQGIDAMNKLTMQDSAQLTRTNEIAELLGKCEDVLRTKSGSRKRRLLYNRLIHLMRDNEWKIKDTILANKVGLWIVDYIEEGNLAAFSNFCRLKVMTHKGLPIYSIEETM